MNENRLWRLADELLAILNEYGGLKTEVAAAQARLRGDPPDTFELRAVGSILDDVYHGAEAILRRIAREIDGQIPTGKNWHQVLLSQMAGEIPNLRPAVISQERLSRLTKYRRFRHVFRNIYGFSLDWSQMGPLLEDALLAIETFERDIKQFVTFLRTMGNAVDE